MQEIAARNESTNGLEKQVLNELAAMLNQTPTFADLGDNDKMALLKSVYFDELKQQLKTAAGIARINYDYEKQIFLNNYKSTCTRNAYTRAIERIEQYAEKININVLELKPLQADNFIYEQNQGRAAASVRRDIAAASSFFTFLERRHEQIKNPFRGTKARPKKQVKRAEQYPNAQEVETIINALPNDLQAMAFIMANMGLRVGALPGLRIKQNKRFTTYTKVKTIGGTIPESVYNVIENHGFNIAAPFADANERTIVNKFLYYTKKLAAGGAIAAAYSCHDLRHYFAVTEYNKDKDIHRISKLLNHSSIAITELYLKELNAID